MISALFFVWFAVATFWTINALRHPVPPGKGMAPLWLPGMIVSELSGWFLLGRAAIAAGFLAQGAAEVTVGQVGLALFVFSEVGLLVVFTRSIRAARSLGHPVSIPGIFRVWDRTPRGEVITAEVSYADGLSLDVHGPESGGTGPCLIYLHPGSWMRGKPGRQARPLFHRLVADGWVVLDVRYPLSPDATFPDHLVGVKRAIAWAKADNAHFGVDPRKVFVSGGSAGAHLAALAALTPNREMFQQGFEAEDTSVAGCIAFYGIYDFFNRNRSRYDWPFIAKHVMKAGRATQPELYRMASPLDQVGEGAPPFLVVHGELDSVVLPVESHYFVKALEGKGVPVEYREIIGAQHGFDGLAGLRAKAVANLSADWLNNLVGNRSEAIT